MLIPLSSRITISSHVLAQEISGETVLLDLQSENYFGLDEIGTRIWQLLHDHQELQQVFDTMLAEYDVQVKQLENDLNDLLQKLCDVELIYITRATE